MSRGIPAIRFRGFTDEWEERKLGDITTKIGSGKTPRGGSEAYVDDGIPLIRSQNVHDDVVDLSDVVYIDEETNKSMGNSLVAYNDVLLNITGASIGRSAVYKGSKPANVNQHVCIIRPTEDYSSDFIQMNLASSNGQKQIDSSQAGGAREGLNFQQIGKMEFAFPSVQEQNKIGTYFSNLNNLIALHERKVAKLNRLKKAYLSELFPRPGEKVPRRRLAGFAGDWEQRKLGDVAEVKDSARIPNDEWTESGVPYIRASDISNDDLSGVLFISKDKYEFYKERTGAPNKNDVLFNGGGEIGKAVLKEDDTPVYVQGGAVLYVRTSESEHLRGDYLTAYFSTKSAKQYIEVASAGGTMKHCTLKPAQNMPVVFPSVEEQTKIGDYFTKLDNLITLNQRKLGKLQALKKAYLAEMFV